MRARRGLLEDDAEELGSRGDHRLDGFTLVELLVVIVIILMVSIVALPTIISALSHRQVSEAARVVQGALVGARDQAIHDGRPSGIRLLPDPVLTTLRVDGTPDPKGILAFNRIVPIGPAPDHSQGNLSVLDPASYANAIRRVNGATVPCLVVEESVLDEAGVPNEPTSWWWNIRLGDKMQINQSGRWYTVVGPMVVANPEQFVNVGSPGTQSPLIRNGTRPEYLLLVNGRDDNKNGRIDEGFDGIDNDGDGTIDEADEWEVETW